MGFATRVKNAWNAFRNKDPSELQKVLDPDGFTYSPGGMPTLSPMVQRRFLQAGSNKTLAVAIFERIATDVANVDIKHVRVNDNGGYVETLDTGLNYILTTEANIDQTGREFIKDVVLTMMDGNGVAACVPIDTSIDPMKGSFDILTMRVGKVTDWRPYAVNVTVYNERSGMMEQIWLPKETVGLIVNPFRDIMNEPNSTMQRLIRTLGQMDDINDRAASGKIDLIIQLPYAIKGEARVKEAQNRVKQIEAQLAQSDHGIAYMDSTEKVIQLNRAVENTLLQQAKDLEDQLYTQLGVTSEIMNGSANESTMINYYNRVINPILDAIVDEFNRKFLTKTARTQKQIVKYYRDPFELTTSEQIAEIADKFTRNAILSSNEMRSVIGFEPVEDERANELRNKNLNVTDKELNEPILVDDGSKKKGGEEPKELSQPVDSM